MEALVGCNLVATSYNVVVTHRLRGGAKLRVRESHDTHISGRDPNEKCGGLTRAGLQLQLTREVPSWWLQTSGVRKDGRVI